MRRRAYQESGMEGVAEGDSGLEGGAASQPASARPAENVGDGGRDGGLNLRRGMVLRWWVG